MKSKVPIDNTDVGEEVAGKMVTWHWKASVSL